MAAFLFWLSFQAAAQIGLAARRHTRLDLPALEGSSKSVFGTPKASDSRPLIHMNQGTGAARVNDTRRLADSLENADLCQVYAWLFLGNILHVCLSWLSG